MTIPEACELVRKKLSDGGTPPRWSDQQQLSYWNAGRRMLFSVRPYAFYVRGIITSCPADLQIDGTLDVLPEFNDPLVHYVAAMCISEDAEHAANLQTAKGYLSVFETAIA